MKKLSKEQERLLSAVRADLRAAHDELTDATDTYNNAVQDAWLALQNARSKYDAALQCATEFVEGIVGDMQAAYNERSEKWREGDKGLAYDAWMGAWQELSFDADEPEEPEAIDGPDVSIVDALDAVPTEPEQ